MLKTKAQTFNDGVVEIYSVSNIGAPGRTPVEGLTLKRCLRYNERTVGVTRYFAAMQNNARVDKLLRCQLQRDVSTQDVAIAGGETQYNIIQVQYPENVSPPVMDITLQEVTQKYVRS